MTSYLSVDLDYWAEYDKEKGNNSSYAFFQKICRLGLPILVVADHELLLPHINANKCDILCNVDYHSDTFGFIDNTDEVRWYKEHKQPDCGTWSVYVNWRRDSMFHWMYPHLSCYGEGIFYGSGTGVCWKGPEDNPYLSRVIKPWRKFVRNKGVNRINWSSVRAVGIAISPAFFTFETVQKICRELGIEKNKYPKRFLYDPIAKKRKIYKPSNHQNCD